MPEKLRNPQERRAIDGPTIPTPLLQVLLPLALLSLFSLPSVAVWGQDFCAPTSSETQASAAVIAKTEDFAVGRTGVAEDGVTDLTYIEAGEASRVVTVDPFVVEASSFFNPALDQKDSLVIADTPESIYGITGIPIGEFAGQFLVLDPGFVASVLDPMAPQVAVMDSQGNIVSPFEPVGGPALDFDAILTAVDHHPEEDERVFFDSNASEFYFTDGTNQIIRGPFQTLGFPANTIRSGICYNTCDTVLVISRFRNNFQSFLALEYDRFTGEYTGRAISLKNIATPGGDVISIGIDVGFLNGSEVLYVYNDATDAIYALALEYSLFPGAVDNLTCTRGAGRQQDVSITWDINPAFDYDSIVIHQNGVEIATLPPDQMGFSPPPSVANTGFNEYIVELRKDGQPNDIRAYCADTSSPRPQFSPLTDALLVQISLDGSDFLLGMDATPAVQSLDDFRLYFFWTFDDILRVLDVDLTLVESIELESGGVDRFTGIALIEVGGEPMLAALGLNADNLSSGSIHRLDGSLFQTTSPVDMTALPDGGEGGVMTDWDADAEGRLVGIDISQDQLVLIEYDSDAGAMVAVDAEPIPQCAISPCDSIGLGVPPLAGGLSILPNGAYLVSGGDSFDDTITRALLSTPFSDDPAESVKFVGYSQGLLAFFQFFSSRLYGVGTGPELSLGLAATHFEYTTEDGTPVSEDVSFYSMPGFGPQVPESLLSYVTSASAHPAVEVHQLLDQEFQGDDETGSLRPIFSGSTEMQDYFYYVINPGDQPISLRVEVLLEGVVDETLTEDVVIHPGRYIYRALFDQTEDELNIRVSGVEPEAAYRILVGTRALPDDEPRGGFRRGDGDGDGVLSIGDPITNLAFQFVTGEALCLDALDFDDSGAIELADPIANIAHQFLGGSQPPAPGKDFCGPDPTADKDGVDLGCESYPQEECN